MDFVDKVKDFMDKGAAASKNAFAKAGSAVQEFSDKSVLKIEIKQLESKKNQCYTKLGKIIGNSFLDGAESVSSTSDEVKQILDDIKEISAEIENKQAELLKEQN